MDLEKLRLQFYEKFPFQKLVRVDPRIIWGVVAAIPVVLFVAAYFQLISPKLEEVSEKRVVLTNKTNDLLMKQSLNGRIDEFKKQLEVLDTQLEFVKEQLPEQKEIPNLLDQVSNLGTQSDLEFLRFKPMKEIIKDFYAEVPVELKIVGKFHDLVSFFDKVGRMPRIMTISDLNVTKSNIKKRIGQVGTLVLATCKATTFRFIESRVDDPSDKGKKKKG